jgi:hypothetical protein
VVVLAAAEAEVGNDWNQLREGDFQIYFSLILEIGKCC